MGALLFSTACIPPLLSEPPAPRQEDTGPQGNPDVGFPDGGIGGNDLALTRLAPGNGPFLGGNEVLVRGGGFEDGMTIEIGGRLVDAPDLDVVDQNRALILAMPAGEPGPADVVVTLADGSAVTLADGYTYNALALDPSRGSVSGGTRVTITGMATEFAEGDVVLFGRRPCTDLEIVSTSTLRCETPASAPGYVDVTYMPSERDPALEPIVLEDAFEFYDASDPTFGGLAGGPLEGTLNVSVFDAATGLPVPDAFVFVGDQAEEHQGLTNILGQITFSGDDLFGQQVVHAAKFCYETTSWVAFDAQNVSIFLTPWLDLRCGDPGSGGGAGAGRSGAFVSGELIWTAGIEFEVVNPNPWDNVPEPRNSDWTRVAYVYATQPCAGTSPSCTNPDPSTGGSIQRIVESSPGRRGYPYRIFVRPAAFAVYSLAGLENRRTREFVPYVMGIARNILAGPGEEIDGADMVMNIPLDHYLDVRLEDLPEPTVLGPNRFEVSADVDLGGEGVIVRRVFGESLDVATAVTKDQPFRFYAQPAIQGALSDGRYRVEAGWVTGSFGSDPVTVARLAGIRDVDSEVVVRGFPPIAVPTAPAFGERIPDDRILRWESEGGTEPDYYFIGFVDSNNNPAWRYFVRGDQTSAPIPNLADIPGLDLEDIEDGLISWFIYAVRIPGFDFDEMTYRDLRRSSWNAWSVDTHTARQ
ncbi:MAG: IPT/TIG domain-containing protein [Polyangiales bacterium]